LSPFLVFALALVGCGHPLATVKNTSARYDASASVNGELGVAQQNIIAAEKASIRPAACSFQIA
jgi:hypothetical protein